MISAELGKTLENYIQKLVDTGRYGSKIERCITQKSCLQSEI